MAGRAVSSPARSLRIALPSLLLLLGPALGPCTAHGRQPEPPMPGTIQEREAYRLLGSDKPIKARELAEQILVRHPDSYAGHHVLGRVLHEQEANLPRALFFLRRAVKLFEEQCAQRGQRCGEEAWRWRARTLLSLAFLCSDMDRREEELQWLDLYDESYKPKRWALRAWALMKLDRFAEARQTAWEGIAAPDPDEQDSSWTALCAIASEEQRFAEAYILCR
ncbi:MAG: hypothetical protein FJ125_08975, partial [Deltaproteobacteria bacterium]|nr:hypothetical protein [Deltaproteobacteria bacterium]